MEDIDKDETRAMKRQALKKEGVKPVPKPVLERSRKNDPLARTQSFNMREIRRILGIRRRY